MKQILTKSHCKDSGMLLHSITYQLLTSARRLGSELFNLYVGPDKVEFKVHTAILRKSPVLEALCDGPFLENQTKIINFPEDDANTIEFMLECLYSNDDQPNLNFIQVACEESNTSFLVQLAELYIAADKYQLQGIQAAVVHHMYSDLQVNGDISTFLAVARIIYDNTGTNHGHFPEWFRMAVRYALGVATPDGLRMFRDQIRDGGDLAADIFSAMVQANGI